MTKRRSLETSFDQPAGAAPLSLREAIKNALDLFSAAFNRRLGDRQVDHLASIMTGYEPDLLWRAAQRIARSGESVPTPAAWRQVAETIAREDGRHDAYPWSVPPWAQRVSSKPEWGIVNRGGFYWLGEHGKPGQTWAFDDFGIASRTGSLVFDPKGFLVFVPNGQRAEDQPDWDKDGPTAREFLKALVGGIGRKGQASGLRKDLPEGMRHASDALVESFQHVQVRGP